MEKSPNQFTDFLIIGAGMSGMAAASELSRVGLRVLVVDKGRGVGGRMASRRIGEAVFDHGAQFITARSDRFSHRMQEWCAQGAVREWCRGFSAAANGHPRWRGNPNMTALPKYLAKGIEVLLKTKIISISLKGSHWSVALEDGASISSASLLLTAPVPRSLAMLDAGNFEMSSDVRSRLEAIHHFSACSSVVSSR